VFRKHNSCVFNRIAIAEKENIMTIVQADFNVIEMLDLAPIKAKLMHKKSGEGWSLKRANATESEYRRFLYLMKKFPTEPVLPLVDVDIFWHYHILDTMKYAADCESVFGYFLHHFPYAGMRGKEDEDARQDAGTRTHEIYEQTYGDSDAPAKQQANAYCYTPTSKQQANAYCYTPTSKQQANAYCYTPTSKQQANAYCYTPTAKQKVDAVSA
jgi:hypothetical protein